MNVSAIFRVRWLAEMCPRPPGSSPLQLCMVAVCCSSTVSHRQAESLQWRKSWPRLWQFLFDILFFFIWGRLEFFLKLFTISSGYNAFYLRLTHTFLEKEELCWGTATFLDFDWVMLEDSYLFDYLYHEKLLTTDQVLCFQPISCPAADIQKAMSAYNRPR